MGVVAIKDINQNSTNQPANPHSMVSAFASRSLARILAKLYTADSRKFEVLGTRDSFSMYRKFKLLGGRNKYI